MKNRFNTVLEQWSSGDDGSMFGGVRFVEYDLEPSKLKVKIAKKDSELYSGIMQQVRRRLYKTDLAFIKLSTGGAVVTRCRYDGSFMNCYIDDYTLSMLRKRFPNNYGFLPKFKRWPWFSTGIDLKLG